MYLTSHISLFFAVTCVQSALGAPASPEFHYQTEDGKIVNRPTTSRPVTFKDVAIGTTELNKLAEPGAIHLLEDGHHFFHQGWYLSDSDAGTPIWQYLPDRRNSSSDIQPKKRQSEGLFIDSHIDYAGRQILEIQFEADLYYTLDLADEISWSADFVGSIALDLFDNGSFVTSSTSLVGDLAGIFFNALEFFS